MTSDNSETKEKLQKVSRSFLNAQKYHFSDLYSPLGSSQTIYQYIWTISFLQNFGTTNIPVFSGKYNTIYKNAE